MTCEFAEILIRVGLLLVGLGVVIHYHLVSNFITSAPHWVKAVALPLCTGGGVGMIYCAFSGAVLPGLGFSLWSCAAVMAVQLEAWREGVRMSRQFAKFAKFKNDKAAMIRDWVLKASEFRQDFYPEQEPDKSKNKVNA